jgi:alpha-beta hydrolase superfamily lysophospholipase
VTSPDTSRRGEERAKTAHPLWFGPAAHPLFAWVHVPDDGRARGAVVLCPPLARELTSVQDTYRLMAERLAAAGLLAVRFDYEGTGDSSGDDGDPRRVESWLESIAHAVELARACGAERVSLVGMRVGALLAAVAAAGLESIDAVVLWDPSPSGRGWVREQAALQRLRGDVPVSTGPATELPGFVYRAETVGDLGRLAVPAHARAPSRVLLATRPDRPAAAELASALGREPALAEARGQDELLEVEPLLHKIPLATLDAIVAWLVEGNRAEPRPVSVPRRDAATFGVEGSLVTERIVRLGPAGLFAVASEPEIPTGGPTALLLNSGNDWHVGPNRLWVELARRWAAAGVRTVRFDESGLGDSPPRPGEVAHVVRAPAAFDDVGDAAAAVCPEDPTNVVLVGLCSGGYQALEHALARPVRAVYAINPVLHFAPPEAATGPIDPRRRICQPATGLAQAYRWLPIAPLRRRLGKLAWRAAHLLHRHRDPSNWLGQLRDDGVKVLVICGEDEARPFASVASDGAGGVAGERIRIDVIPGLDHALMPAFQRAEVTRLMTEHLVGHFAPAREPSLPRGAPA